MHSQEEDMEEDCMEEEGGRLYGELETTVENTRDQVCPAKIKWVQGKTQIQWIWTKEKKEIGLVMCVESGAIWPEIARKDGKRGG